jgi:predicted phosphodiesterase
VPPVAALYDATIVVGGDICAGGEQPSETLTRLRGLGDRVAWVRGNADRELYPGESGVVPESFVEETRGRLSEEEIAFLHALPPTQRVGEVLYCHASPRNDLDIFTERTPEERIAFLFDGLDVPTVVCGHTHMQFERAIGGVRVVNAGSVGMPYEDEPGAYWLLDLVHRRTPYEGAELKATREDALAEFTERGL